jgi:predicted nucleic acid-binding protein
VILTDAGPLVALLDCGEPDHVRCREALERLHGPMLTTWPTFTEAMSLLGEAGGGYRRKRSGAC